MDLFSDISCPKTLREASLNRSLSALGDSIVNSVLSLALSRASGRAEGRRATNAALSEAILDSEASFLIPNRSDRHRRADIAEAIVAYSLLKKTTTLEELVDELTQELADHKMTSRKDEKMATVAGFRKILNLLIPRLK